MDGWLHASMSPRAVALWYATRWEFAACATHWLPTDAWFPVGWGHVPTYTPDAHSWVELARACRERGLPIVESVTVMAARLHLDEIAGTGEQIGRRSPCVDVAVAVCEGCPIRVQCLEYAMAASEPGIWGGLTDRGRREERARRRRTRHHRS